MRKWIIAIPILLFVSCSSIAVFFTAKKKMVNQETPLGREANLYFWTNYHSGNYDSIPKIIQKLDLALQENPNDLRIVTHLGFVHIWALAERQRLLTADPSIAEQLILSRRYFAESYDMNPHDPRILGFLGDLTLAEGKQLNEARQQVDGYFKGKEAIRQWPQFNKFTLGYVMSNLDSSDKRFKEAIAWQYETFDDCACSKGLKNTDYSTAFEKIRNSADPIIYRACWNSWIAPHNWEGFCLNFGDMLIKSGNTAEGIKMYTLAKKSPTYNEWPFQQELEKRIANAKINTVLFNKPIDNAQLSSQTVIMFNSSMACSGCHQMSHTEFAALGYKEPGDEYYFLRK